MEESARGLQTPRVAAVRSRFLRTVRIFWFWDLSHTSEVSITHKCNLWNVPAVTAAAAALRRARTESQSFNNFIHRAFKVLNTDWSWRRQAHRNLLTWKHSSPDESAAQNTFQ